MNISSLNSCPIRLASQQSVDSVFMPQSIRNAKGGHLGTSCGNSASRPGKAETVVGLPGGLCLGGRSSQPGARGSVGSGTGRVGGAVIGGRCDEKRALGQLAAQQPHRTR